jgi:hypothetical protein
MSSTTSPCWACQSVNTSKTAKCRVCSPSPPHKSHLTKPQNIHSLRHLGSLALRTVIYLNELHNFNEVAINKDIASPSTMNTRAVVPDHEILTLNLLPFELPWTKPAITLTGPANDYPTMDLDTFHVLAHGRTLHDSSVLRIGPASKGKKKHKKGDKCDKCDQAALATAHFAQGITNKVILRDEPNIKPKTYEEALADYVCGAYGTKQEKIVVKSRDKQKFTGSKSRYKGRKASRNIESWLEDVMANLGLAEKAPRIKAGLGPAEEVTKRTCIRQSS